MRHRLSTQHVQQLQHVNHMDESAGGINAEGNMSERQRTYSTGGGFWYVCFSPLNTATEKHTHIYVYICFLIHYNTKYCNDLTH